MPCRGGRCRDDSIAVRVKIPADLACEGREKWKDALIDACIAPIVRALQDGGIDMRGSCCGHGQMVGQIQLQDGRMLLVLDTVRADRWLTAEPRDMAEVVRPTGLDTL